MISAGLALGGGVLTLKAAFQCWGIFSISMSSEEEHISCPWDWNTYWTVEQVPREGIWYCSIYRETCRRSRRVFSSFFANYLFIPVQISVRRADVVAFFEAAWNLDACRTAKILGAYFCRPESNPPHLFLSTQSKYEWVKGMLLAPFLNPKGRSYQISTFPGSLSKHSKY